MTLATELILGFYRARYDGTAHFSFSNGCFRDTLPEIQEIQEIMGATVCLDQGQSVCLSIEKSMSDIFTCLPERVARSAPANHPLIGDHPRY